MFNIVQPDKIQDTKKQPRDYGFDNIRAILMTCVVIGHLLEVCTPFRGCYFIYKTIYSFHIPVFVFLTGYFARYNVKKILFNWVSPFLVFQMLYIMVERLMNINTPYQFSTPYWHLWFLIACVFYQFLIPAYETTSFSKQVFVLICVTTLSLAVGFDKTMGHYLALSRFFVFQPWFLLGYYFRKYSARQSVTATIGCKTLRAGAVIVALCVGVIVIHICKVPNKAFYGSYPYDKIPNDLIYRMIVMCVSFIWVVFFVKVLRPLLQRKVPVMTTLGQNTLPVYILHAFVTKKIGVILPSSLSSPIYIVLITVGILFLFGNPFVGDVFRFLFSGRMLKNLSKKKKTRYDSSVE